MGTLGRLTADQLDLTLNTYDFTQSLSDTLGDHGTTADGFDSFLGDTSLLLSSAGDPGSLLVDDLNLAAGIGSSIDPNSLANDAATLPASIAAGEAILSDASALAGGVGEPAPPTSSGGTTPSSTNCSSRTNQYGISTQGAFPGVRVDRRDTFQVLRVQDGPCTYSQAQYPSTGQTSFPRIVSFTLVSGDLTVWSLGHHQERASDGTIVDLYDVSMTPKLLPAQPRPRAEAIGVAPNPKPQPMQVPSHFDAVGVLVTSNPSQTLNVCMSLDCIP